MQTKNDTFYGNRGMILMILRQPVAVRFKQRITQGNDIVDGKLCRGGNADEFHFSKQFKEHYGKRPKNFL